MICDTSLLPWFAPIVQAWKHFCPNFINHAWWPALLPKLALTGQMILDRCRPAQWRTFSAPPEGLQHLLNLNDAQGYGLSGCNGLSGGCGVDEVRSFLRI